MHHRINHPSVISESLDGEVVVIDLATGTYYSLQGTGARAWDGVAAGLSTVELVADLTGVFDTGGADITAEVERFLASLVAEGLLVAGEAPSEPVPLGPAAADGPAWVTPVLETFTDMQELILLDPVHEVDPAQGWPATPDPAT
jgi:hypothetical protein